MAEWQTRQSQKLLGGNSRVGSSPTFGTTSEAVAFPNDFATGKASCYNSPDKLPSCVAVARGTLDPLAQVRILARQPNWNHFELLLEEKQLIPALQENLAYSN